MLLRVARATPKESQPTRLAGPSVLGLERMVLFGLHSTESYTRVTPAVMMDIQNRAQRCSPAMGGLSIELGSPVLSPWLLNHFFIAVVVILGLGYEPRWGVTGLVNQ